ncbi:MAG: T9SS type A sorting domain-containing protein, partial [Bacteroidia bacterium]|nr:T9SS type A sorting domain-containing protein [Bacteroidia bacterium]
GSGDTEGGSSGSALFNNNGQVIGKLSGGVAIDCLVNFEDNFNLYGKMSYSWDSNGTIAAFRLKDWLDPDDTGAVTLDGVYFPCLVPTDPNDSGISAITYPVDQGIFCENPLAPEVELTNFGIDPLTSVTINYQIDSGTIYTYNWTGNLLSLEKEIVTLPAVNASISSQIVLQAYTTLPNGVTDPDNTNDGSSVTAEFDTTIAIPYSEDFDGFTPNNIDIVDFDNDGFTWVYSNTANAYPETNGAGSVLLMDNWTNNTTGTQDYVFLPSYDFSSASGAFMEFDLAYAQYLQTGTEYSDGLSVLVSSDCGETYTQEYFETGAALATAPSSNGIFVPTTDGEWVTKNINLSAYDGMGNVQIVIVNVGNYSQALYIDNINVNDGNLSLNDNELLDDLIVYPNPTSDILNIKSSVQLEKLELFNILGEKIIITEQTSVLDLKSVSSGVYLLKVHSKYGYTIKRIIVD